MGLNENNCISFVLVHLYCLLLETFTFIIYRIHLFELDGNELGKYRENLSVPRIYKDLCKILTFLLFFSNS